MRVAVASPDGGAASPVGQHRLGRMLGALSRRPVARHGRLCGWSFDTRTESVINEELQTELNTIAAEGAAAGTAATAARAEAEQAALDGDVELEKQKRKEENVALSLAGVRAADIASKIAEAKRTGDVIHDGFESEGAGLGIWTLIVGLAALVMTVPAIGMLGIDELFRYRWSALVAGAGLGIALVALAWVVTIVRVADANFVSGVGIVFVMTAGVTLFATSRALSPNSSEPRCTAMSPVKRADVSRCPRSRISSEHLCAV